jgi:hypothetical protein
MRYACMFVKTSLSGDSRAVELMLDNLAAYDGEFLAFSAEREDLRIESNRFGEVEILPGTSGDTGWRAPCLSCRAAHGVHQT